MILMLDEDHMHYNDSFGNIFEGGTLCKKHLPDGSGGIQTRNGGAAQAIICQFCLHTCSNNDYAYCHLSAIHLNIQWGCGICFGFVSILSDEEGLIGESEEDDSEWSSSKVLGTVYPNSLTQVQPLI